MYDYLGKHLYPVRWSKEKIKDFRESLNLTQKEVADILGVTSTTIKNIELGYTKDPLKLFAYGTILERYFALTNGYTPSYRKIGTNEFTDKI